MKAQTIDIHQCTGRILSSAIFRPGGKKLLAKGHILREEDIRILQSEGMDHIWVAELDEDEVSEDEAVCGIAAEMACGSYEIQMAPGGRANLIATESCCVLVDEELLRQVNCTSGLVIATTLNFSFAVAGQRIATVKSAPFAVSKSDFEGSRNMLRERGPIMQARPARGASIAVLYCDPINGDRAKTLFESVLRQKLERFGIRAQNSIAVLENEEHVSRGIQQLLRARPCGGAGRLHHCSRGAERYCGPRHGKDRLPDRALSSRRSSPAIFCSWRIKTISRSWRRPAASARSNPMWWTSCCRR